MSENNRMFKLVTIGGNATHCQTCSLNALCLPVSLEPAEIEQLDNIVEKSRPLHKGDFLFRQGEKFGSVFVIRAGSVKTFTSTQDGEEQLNGFYFPGELIGLVGLSGLDAGVYPMSAKMLETTSVCEIPFEHLDDLCGVLPELRRQVIRSLSREIRDDQQMIMLLSKKNAEQKIASFLLKLSARYHVRGYSASQFRLSMSRNDIGNYLGLAVETVSRIFTRFSTQKIIKVDGKEVELIDLVALMEAAGESVDPHCQSKAQNG